MTRAALLLLLAPRALLAQPLELKATPESVLLGDPAVSAALSAGAGARYVTQIGHVAEGRWVPGNRRAPGIALVAAAEGDGDDERRGATTIRLRARGQLPTKTSPGASVKVDVAGTVFGPVVADGNGDAIVPVVVPPGVATAIVHAVDREGAQASKTVPLPVAPQPAAVALGPAEVVVGRRGAVSVFAIDASGVFRTEAVVAAKARGVRLAGEPARVAPGRWDVAFVGDAPGEGRIELEIDGRALAPVDVHVVAPDPWRAGRGLFVGLRAGAATAFGSLTSFAAVAEAFWLFHGRTLVPGLGVEVTASHGTSTSFLSSSQQEPATQLLVAATGRVRVPLGPLVRLEAACGLGAAAAFTTRTGAALLWFVGLGAAVRVPGGEIAVDVRWQDVRYPELDTRLEGNAMGLVVTAGYRLAL